MNVNDPPDGVTSAVRTKKSFGLVEFRFVAQMCAWPVDSPPVMFMVTCWAAVASMVSMTVL